MGVPGGRGGWSLLTLRMKIKGAGGGPRPEDGQKLSFMFLLIEGDPSYQMLLKYWILGMIGVKNQIFKIEFWL